MPNSPTDPIPTGCVKIYTGTANGLPVSVDNPLYVARADGNSALTATELESLTLHVTGTVAVSNQPAVQPVSGTFWPASQPVSGSVSVSSLPSVAVSNFPAPPATQAVTGVFWPSTQPVSGAVTANPTLPGTGTRTSPTVGATVTTVLPANPARRGATLFHDGSGNCFLALGANCSLTDFGWRMVANDYFQVPFGYTGIITAIRASGTNPLRVTELT